MEIMKETETQMRVTYLDFERQAAKHSCLTLLTVQRAEAEQAHPVKDSATRWHLKASLSRVVGCGGTGQCQHCSREGLKCLWGELQIWGACTGFAEKSKGGSGNKKPQQPSPEETADPNFGSELHLQNKLSDSQKTIAASYGKLELGLEFEILGTNFDIRKKGNIQISCCCSGVQFSLLGHKFKCFFINNSSG